MTKKKINININDMIKDLSVYDQNISKEELKKYVLEIMTRYGINVLLQRMAPSIIDGLIPAKRRALFTLFNDMNSTPDGDFNKVADIAGRTIGKYHPHGLASVESTITNMGKRWSMNTVLVEPRGNFGSILGAPPAAGRYIEAKLSDYAYKCLFEDYDPDILDMIPNYTRREMEPLYLPSKYPNFLVCGNSGIGVGFTSEIPKFNLREAFELTMGLMDNPNMSQVHLFPDSPRGFNVIDRGDTIKICNDGDGSFLMRGKMNLVEDKKEGTYIQITNVPEKTNMEKINDSIIELIKAGRIQGVKNIRDESKLTYIDYRLMLKVEANPYEIMEIIYKSTSMQDSINLKMNFAEKTNFVSMGLKDSIQEWILQREDIKQRSYAKTLRTYKEREHMLDILITILSGDNAKRTISIFENSDNKSQAMNGLIDTFNITTMQADSIASMSYGQLTRDSRNRYIKEYENIKGKIIDIEGIVRNRHSVYNNITKELEEGIKLFGKDRNCDVIDLGSLKKVVTNHTIVVTKKFIKKLSDDVKNPGSISQGDEVVKMLRDVPNDSKITILDVKGRIYNIAVDKLVSNELVSKGTDLLQSFGVNADIIFVFWTHSDHDNTNKYLVTFTESGIIKKSSLSEYDKLRMSVSQGAVVGNDDKICYATLVGDDRKSTLVYLNNGYGMIIDLDNVNITGRVSKGFNHVKAPEGASIQGICDGDTDTILIMTKKGYGKLCRLSDVDQARKKDDLTRLTSLNDDDEVIFIKAVTPRDVIRVTYEDKYIDMNVNDIPMETRLSKGSKIVPVKRGTNIIKVSVI